MQFFLIDDIALLVCVCVVASKLLNPLQLCPMHDYTYAWYKL